MSLVGTRPPTLDEWEKYEPHHSLTPKKASDGVYCVDINGIMARNLNSNYACKVTGKNKTCIFELDYGPFSYSQKVINSLISRDYGKRFIVNHYYDKDQPLPIWAIFELISLGEFGTFVGCLDQNTRKKISKSVGIKVAYDRDGKLLPLIVYALKDLRNAVAHNNTIFDARFKTGTGGSH